MEWSILFTINWILFFILVDWKTLKKNVFGGLFITVVEIFVDYHYTSLGLYTIHDPIIEFLGSSLFFSLGPVFVIGTLMAQYHPHKRWMIVVNIIVIFILYSIMELILVKRGVVEYINWSYFASLIINIGAMTIQSWFIIIVLGKWREKR
jgi:hypothetical protein